MWSSLFLGLQGFASAQEVDLDEDEAVVTDSMSEDPGYRIPTREELLKALDSMGLSEEEKNNLRENLMKNTPLTEAKAQAGRAFATSDFTSQTILLLALLSLIALIFVFFGYKLYKSLSERERKREEKRKMKQMKKKK